jgi:YjbE family integral membrane protein
MLTLASLAQIILVNTVLSGDNALVIAMAARHLPEPDRRTAMIWGVSLAVALQIVLTLAVAYVMMIPGLRFVGAVLLFGISCKLVQDEDQTAHEGAPVPTSMLTAIFRIAVADLVMSLDNVIAIAGLSGSDPVLLTVGLILSIAVIVVFSQVILVLMNRFRWIVYAGTGVLALTAAGMIVHDLEAVYRVAWTAGSSLHFPLWADWSLRGLAVVACITSTRWWPRRIAMVGAP